MTLKILLIRHGETDGNLKGFVQNADTPLNTVGKNQANLLYKELGKRNISQILSSDYLRARQTIESFVEETNIPCSWSAILRERDFGELKGKFYKDINSSKVFEESFSPPGGENLQQFEKRVDSAWNEILKVSNSLTGELAIVTHGLVIKDFLKRKLFLAKSISSKYEIVPNTSITIFEPIYPFNVVEFASIKHLKSFNINKGIA